MSVLINFLKINKKRLLKSYIHLAREINSTNKYLRSTNGS